MSTPRAREQRHPPSPPDCLPPHRGVRPSLQSAFAAGASAVLSSMGAAARALFGPATVLAAAACLALPAMAQAQEIALVSNIAESQSGFANIYSPDFALGSIQIGERKAAQRFTTRPNTAGYLLQSVVLNLHAGVGTGNAVHVAIHENSSGNPGTQLALLNNPADPIGNDTGTAGNRTFSAPSPLPLDANTQYCTPICRGRSIE